MRSSRIRCCRKSAANSSPGCWGAAQAVAVTWDQKTTISASLLAKGKARGLDQSPISELLFWVMGMRGREIGIGKKPPCARIGSNMDGAGVADIAVGRLREPAGA